VTYFKELSSSYFLASRSLEEKCKGLGATCCHIIRGVLKRVSTEHRHNPPCHNRRTRSHENTNSSQCANFEALTRILLKIKVWLVFKQSFYWTLKMSTLASYESPQTTCPTSKNRIPVELNLHISLHLSWFKILWENESKWEEVVLTLFLWLYAWTQKKWLCEQFIGPKVQWRLSELTNYWTQRAVLLLETC
jgi:hypothetical protein